MATCVPRISFDKFLTPQVKKRINCSVKRLGRKFAMNHADCQDLRQDFLLAMVTAHKIYDPSKCVVSRFVAMVINRRYKWHVRRQMNMREGIGKLLDIVGFDDVAPNLAEHIVDRRTEGNPQKQLEMREEIDTVLHLLTPLERQICQLLLEGHNPYSISKHLGVAPSTVTRALKRIRTNPTVIERLGDF